MFLVADMWRHLVQQFLQILTNFIRQIGHYAILWSCKQVNWESWLLVKITPVPTVISFDMALYEVTQELAAWRSGNGVGRINEVTQRRAR